MKKILLIPTIAFSINAFAQPVILNANNFPSVGYTTSVYSASSAVGAGNSGASQTWNFSSIAFSLVGTINVVNPSTSAFALNYPTANVLFTISVGVNASYFYWDTTATRLDAITEGITTPGSGKDFSPDPEQLLKFPFNFTDSITDTYQQIGNSPDLESLVYDGYGSLILPFNTFNNVVRIKAIRSGGIVYYWYTLNPLFPVLVYRESNNSYTAINSISTGVDEIKLVNDNIQIYPNPAKNKLTINIYKADLSKQVKLSLVNSLGQTIKQIPINSIVTTTELDNIPSGVYFYLLEDSGNVLKSGKIILE